MPDIEAMVVGVAFFAIAFFMTILFRNLEMPEGINPGWFIAILLVFGVALIGVGILSKKKTIYIPRY